MSQYATLIWPSSSLAERHTTGRKPRKAEYPSLPRVRRLRMSRMEQRLPLGMPESWPAVRNLLPTLGLRARMPRACLPLIGSGNPVLQQAPRWVQRRPPVCARYRHRRHATFCKGKIPERIALPSPRLPLYLLPLFKSQIPRCPPKPGPGPSPAT
jgi:hypothetical protein